MKRQIRLNSWRTHIKTGFLIPLTSKYGKWASECLTRLWCNMDLVWWIEFLLEHFQIPAGGLINVTLNDSLLESFTKGHRKTKNESEDLYETYYRDAEGLLEPGGRQQLLGGFPQVRRSSNQGEPEWLLFHLFAKFKQFDTLKSSTERRGVEKSGRQASPTGREALPHLPHPTFRRCRQWPRQRRWQQSVGPWLLRPAALSAASGPTILGSGLGRKK